MSLIQTQLTGKGVLITAGLIAILLVWFYATTLLTVAFGAIVISALLYALYLVAYRTNRVLRDKRLLGGKQ